MNLHTRPKIVVETNPVLALMIFRTTFIPTGHAITCTSTCWCTPSRWETKPWFPASKAEVITTTAMANLSMLLGEIDRLFPSISQRSRAHSPQKEHARDFLLSYWVSPQWPSLLSIKDFFKVSSLYNGVLADGPKLGIDNPMSCRGLSVYIKPLSSQNKLHYLELSMLHNYTL